MSYALAIGNKLIRDIVNPTPEDIDVSELWPRLAVARRFSNNPAALTVLEHVHLVALLADKHGMPAEIVTWCLHHDDHEAIITDIPGPLKALIGEHTHILRVVEERLDSAICTARSMVEPTDAQRRIVHVFDKMAESIEWQFVLCYTAEPWNLPIPWKKTEVDTMLQEARLRAVRALKPKSKPPRRPDVGDNGDWLDDEGFA